MRVAVIGGMLQGVEATYLAHKAGWEVILVDKNRGVPAEGLCDNFHQIDVSQEKDFLRRLAKFDFFLPALENEIALSNLCKIAKQADLPLAFDSKAYDISSSKIKSNRLFSDLDLPVPLAWPRADIPLIAKPSMGSGSAGVRRIDNLEDFQSIIQDKKGEWVIEEFMEGPSFSIEVVGSGKHHRALQVTDLQMDTNFDCKRVKAPTILSNKMIGNFEQEALTLAKAINLRGVMDVEVILHDGRLKVLEIDARLPSQTPTVVYLSTGINMVEILAKIFCQNSELVLPDIPSPRGVIYEHIDVSPEKLEVSGEHIMTRAGPLKLLKNFFGADEAITNYRPRMPSWSATLIVVERDRETAWAKRCGVIHEIMKHF
jgi:pyrrolysine biosynthesis protein PylC